MLPGRKLATGGQGEIFAVASPTGFVLKRYLRRTLDSDPALARRLWVMADRRPAEWREAGSGVERAEAAEQIPLPPAGWARA